MLCESTLGWLSSGLLLITLIFNEFTSFKFSHVIESSNWFFDFSSLNGLCSNLTVDAISCTLDSFINSSSSIGLSKMVKAVMISGPLPKDLAKSIGSSSIYYFNHNLPYFSYPSSILYWLRWKQYQKNLQWQLNVMLYSHMYHIEWVFSFCWSKTVEWV